MASRLGQHLLLSLGVVTGTALLVALPALLSGAAPSQDMASAAARLAAISRDGKITDRLGEAGPPELGTASAGTLLSAALSMPMTLSWPDSAEWAPAGLAVVDRQVRPSPGTIRQASHQPVQLRDRSARANGGPLVILPPASATAIDAAATAEPPEADIWSRLVVAPTAKVADAVSGAAGSVQAAGSWGLSQVGGLLPRW